jgi:diguanylate cyclase (GGDEF)-like protein
MTSMQGRDRRGLTTFASLYVGSTVVVSVLLTTVLVMRDAQRVLEQVETQGRALAGRLDQELARRGFVVDALAAHAENLLTFPSSALPVATAHLTPDAGRESFALALPAGSRTEHWGNLTGEGPIPAPDSRRAREMAVALALTPAFHAAAAQMPGQPWAYYFSRDRFLYLYPRVDADQVHWSTELAAEHFSLRGKALTQFERRLYWSAIYRDKGGKGLLATASRPVFDGALTLGTVNVDIAMQTLLDILAAAVVPCAQVELLDADGRAMDLSSSDTHSPLTDGAPHDHDALDTPFDFALRSGWTLRVRPERDAIVAEALQHSLVYVVFLVLVTGGLVLAVLLRRALRQVEALSIRDSLTGLFNRRHFDEVAAVEVARARRGTMKLGLAIVDVDHFKAFNDRYGHHGGDETLRAVADALLGSLRRAGDQVFRIGGEEFAILADVQTTEQMSALAARLREAVRSLNRPHEGSPLGQVTISVGHTVVQAADWVDKETAYRRADEALYRAKAAGRDRVEAG